MAGNTQPGVRIACGKGKDALGGAPYHQRADRRFAAIDRASSASKNLYNAANYEVRQAFIFQGIYLGTLIIGQNLLWKQEVNIGRRGNQHFVSVPHARFIEMLTYKVELAGIQGHVTEERYTSKASFLDADLLPVHGATEPPPVFSGRRVKRGLYRAADGRPIQADVNGADNIIRKVAPEAFARGSRGCVVHPVRLAV